MDNSALERQCNALRLELKAWEKTFAAEHDGRKAGRDDIKANATISLKYKEYNKLRETLSAKTEPQTPSKRAVSRRPAHEVEGTPKARRKSLHATPLKRKRDSGVEFEDVQKPTSEFLSPQGPTMIGPTPQRDGIVLGLFDMLPTGTPSKRRMVLGEVESNVLQTPSKNGGTAESDISLDFRERTPQSISKRFLLDQFVTPQKRQRYGSGTPPSALKGFSTPSFLRRDNVLDVVIEDQETTPRPAPWKRRGLGRSLSSMIQSLKKQEEDRLDEEAEIMREAEMEAEGIIVPKKPRIPEILVEDSQVQMPLGPDRGVNTDDESEEEAHGALDRNGNPRKAWKKRGQKRTTRRVIMRPNFVKPLAAPAAPAAQEHDDGSEAEDVVGETQPNPDNADGNELSESDDGESEYATDDSHTSKKRKRQHKQTDVVANTDSLDRTITTGPVKKAAKKIKATAHANYRKLKIKSKGGSGKAGNGKGRFARRR